MTEAEKRNAESFRRSFGFTGRGEGYEIDEQVAGAIIGGALTLLWALPMIFRLYYD